MSTGPRTRVIGAEAWTGYAVPAPDDSARMTYWFTDDALRMRPWPPDTRYAPFPPAFDSASKRERTAYLNGWYADVYFEFLQRVADAIAADFDVAAARFTDAFGAVMFPRQRAAAARRLTSEFDRRRVRFEAITAASRVRAGRSIADVARHLGVAWETARKRVLTGEKLLADDPDGARAFIVEYLRRALEDDDAERLAASLLDGARFEAARVAARLATAELGPTIQAQPAGDSAWTHALRSFLSGGA